MNSLLTNLSFWQIFVILITLIISICGTVLLIVFKKSIKVGLGKDRTIEIGNENNEEKTDKKNNNYDLYVKNILLILEKFTEVTMKKAEIIYNANIRCQMNYADQRLIILKNFFQDNFLNYLKKEIKYKGDLTVQEDYVHFCKIMESCNDRVADVIRRSFKENHFVDLNENDFEKFIDEKVELIIGVMKKIINSLYWEKNREVSKSAIYDLLFGGQNTFEIRKFICGIFKEAVKIKKKLDEEMQTIDCEFSNFFNDSLQVFK